MIRDLHTVKSTFSMEKVMSIQIKKQEMSSSSLMNNHINSSKEKELIFSSNKTYHSEKLSPELISLSSTLMEPTSEFKASQEQLLNQTLS